MVESPNTDWPRGFGGAVEGWHAILASACADRLESRILRLPQDGIEDGAFLRVPPGEFDVILVGTVCEGFGQFEGFLRELAKRLAPGGRLFVDASCEQGPRQLRVTLEGRANCMDPVGSLRRREVPLSTSRLVRGVAATGLVVRDLLRLPHPDRYGPEFMQSMISLGLMATSWAAGAPPARLWALAQRTQRRAGSVIIGGGTVADRAATRAALEWLGEQDWEILDAPCRDSVPEHVAFARAVAESTGDTVWFLRAGCRPTRAQFDALWQYSVLAPTLPGVDGVPATPGDIAGLMIARCDLLQAGPPDDSWQSPAIAYEDFAMLLDVAALRVAAIGGPLDGPASPELGGAASAALAGERLDEAAFERCVGQLQQETTRLIERWQGVGVSGDPLHPGSRRRAEQQAAPAPWLGRAPKVTLCMIARDEERFLAECLRRAAPAVDEIILVDTGSQDRTIEIARSFGAHVIEEPWRDDFAAPRNTGLAAASGDWILVLDADEFLEDGSAAEIRRVVADPLVSGYHVHFTNVYDDQKTLGVTMVRLFRNLPGLRWINRIHEQVTPSLLGCEAAKGLILSGADVRVEHHGYTNEVMVSRDKFTRNERLFKMQLEEHPDDIYTLYKYGDFLRRVPDRDRDARDMLEYTLDLITRRFAGCPRSMPYAGEVAALCALEYAREENWNRAEEILELALRQFMVTPNLHYIAAGIALRRGREDEAIAHYRRCLSYRGQTLVVPIQEGITGHVSLTGMAQAYLQKGDREAARRLLRQARGLDPSHDVTVMVLSRLHLQDGDIRRALHELTDYLAQYPNSPGVCQQASLLLVQLGMNDQARRMGNRAVDLLEARAADIEANQLRQKLAALA